MRVAIYIRVSTREQAEEGFSIQMQREKLIAYCQIKDWKIGNIYTDGGFSGSNINRPALQNLIKDIKNYDTILIYKLDRLSRSQKDTLYLIEDIFLKNSVDLISLTESFDTSTPFGKASIGILSVFAQLERETFRERSKAGKQQRAKEGYFKGGKVPLGYDYKDGKLTVNEFEALQVQEIFKLYNSGLGIEAIKRIMEGKNYKNKHNGKFGHMNIFNILKNPTYVGEIYYKGKTFPGKHEAIIDKEEFSHVQMVRSGKQKTYRSYVLNSLLSGFLYCGLCGSRLCSHSCGRYSSKLKSEKEYKYYICYSRKKSRGYMINDPNCKNQPCDQKSIDNMVVSALFRKIETQGIEIKKKLNSEEEEKGKKIKIIKKQINDIDKQINKLLDLYQRDILSVEDLGKKVNALYADKENLNTMLAILKCC